MTIQELQDRFAGVFPGATRDEAKTPWEETIHLTVAAGAAATVYSAPCSILYDCEVVSAKFVNASTIADSTTDELTITLVAYTATATSQIVATLDTDADDGSKDIAAYVATPMTVADSLNSLSEGDCVVAKISPADTDTAWGVGAIDFVLRRRAE